MCPNTAAVVEELVHTGREKDLFARVMLVPLTMLSAKLSQST